MNIDLDKFQFFSDAVGKAKASVEVQEALVRSLGVQMEREENGLRSLLDGLADANAALEAYLAECGYHHGILHDGVAESAKEWTKEGAEKLATEPPTMETDPVGKRLLAAHEAASEPWEYWASNDPSESGVIWKTGDGPYTYSKTDCGGWNGGWNVTSLSRKVLSSSANYYPCNESGKRLEEPTPDPTTIQPDGLPWEYLCNTQWYSEHPPAKMYWHVMGDRVVGPAADKWSREKLSEEIKIGRMVLCDPTGRALPPTPKVREHTTIMDGTTGTATTAVKEPKVREFWSIGCEYLRHVVGDVVEAHTPSGTHRDGNSAEWIIDTVRIGLNILCTPEGVPLYTDPSSPEAQRIIAEVLGEEGKP